MSATLERLNALTPETATPEQRSAIADELRLLLIKVDSEYMAQVDAINAAHFDERRRFENELMRWQS